MSRTGAATAECEFTSQGAMIKTVGLSHVRAGILKRPTRADCKSAGVTPTGVRIPLPAPLEYLR